MIEGIGDVHLDPGEFGHLLLARHSEPCAMNDEAAVAVDVEALTPQIPLSPAQALVLAWTDFAVVREDVWPERHQLRFDLERFLAQMNRRRVLRIERIERVDRSVIDRNDDLGLPRLTGYETVEDQRHVVANGHDPFVHHPMDFVGVLPKVQPVKVLPHDQRSHFAKQIKPRQGGKLVPVRFSQDPAVLFPYKVEVPLPGGEYAGLPSDDGHLPALRK